MKLDIFETTVSVSKKSNRLAPLVMEKEKQTKNQLADVVKGAFLSFTPHLSIECDH